MHRTCTCPALAWWWPPAWSLGMLWLHSVAVWVLVPAGDAPGGRGGCGGAELRPLWHCCSGLASPEGCRSKQRDWLCLVEPGAWWVCEDWLGSRLGAAVQPGDLLAQGKGRGTEPWSLAAGCRLQPSFQRAEPWAACRQLPHCCLRGSWGGFAFATWKATAGDSSAPSGILPA